MIIIYTILSLAILAFWSTAVFDRQSPFYWGEVSYKESFKRRLLEFLLGVTVFISLPYFSFDKWETEEYTLEIKTSETISYFIDKNNNMNVISNLDPKAVDSSMYVSYVRSVAKFRFLFPDFVNSSSYKVMKGKS